MKISNKIKKAFLVVFAVATVFFGGASIKNAGAISFTVSPTSQRVALVPGQTYKGTFEIANPQNNTEDFKYKVEVNPFHMDDNYNVVLEEKGDYNQIVKWITIENPTGSIHPNSVEVVRFSIKVPEDAPAGAQYAALSVSSDYDTTKNEGMNIQQVLQFSHLLYADVAGESKHDAKLVELSVPGFIFDGQVSGTGAIRNNGNVYADAEYVLQVFPLFSNEEIYTNEESPQQKIVLPDSTRRTSTIWEKTPPVGIFNVKYTVKIDGSVAGQVEKLVIKCPVWLLFVVIFVIAAIVIWLISRSVMRKNGKK